jgi:hypothetical protein
VVLSFTVSTEPNLLQVLPIFIGKW